MTATPAPAVVMPPIRPPSSRILAVWGILTGLVTLLVGSAWILLGMGFGNATACGTGAAAACVGAWTVFAARGIARRRLQTFAGLGLAWTWLFGRMIFDHSAMTASSVVVLFLMPAPAVFLGLLWIVLVLIGGLASLYRGVGIWRRRGDMVDPASRPRLRPPLGLAVRLVLLVGLTLLMPAVAWHHSTQQIAELAKRYAQPPEAHAAPVQFGACSMVFLGYELTQHADPAAPSEVRQASYDRALADAQAELASIVAAGAGYVRAGASGDQLLADKPDQEAVDDKYMAAVRAAGLKTVLVDTQHPKVLQKRKLDWSAFCDFQRRRIEYYQRRYHPDVYLVACEPKTYHHFALTPNTAFSAEAWSEQLAATCRLVKSIDPSTRTGLTVLVSDDHEEEWSVWSRLKTLPEIDILSVEIYEPKHFRQTEDRLARYGHPRDFGKSFWIAETYNGWALCGNRRWELDAAWIRLLRGYGRVVDAETILVWTFGTFVPGGNLLDFGKGKLDRRWQESGKRLSLVGQAFAESAGASAP